MKPSPKKADKKTSSETQMVRKHEVTSYEYIRVDIAVACVIGAYPFVGWHESDAERQMSS